MEARIEHEPGRFVARVGDLEAFLTYRLAEGVLDVQHTYTPPALRGRELAARLTAAAFAYAREQGFRVRPTCSYARVYLDRHPELRGLAAP
jgi:uncharacterized protein